MVYLSYENVFFFFLPSELSPDNICGSFSTYSNVWELQDCATSGPFVCKKPAEAVPLNPETTGCEKVNDVVSKRERARETSGWGGHC